MNLKSILAIAVALVIGVIVGMQLGGGDERPSAEGPAEGGTGAAAVSLKMASIFPASLDILGDGGVLFTDNVRAASGGRVDIRFFDPGKLVPGLEIFDAVSKGAVDAGWASAGFWIGKLPSAALFSAIPFGPDSTEYLSWMFAGEGKALYQELYAQHNIHVEPCVLIPPEASGWFRQEVQSPEQLRGLKMRFFGLGGKAMQKLGVSVQLLAPGDIFPALERGVLDATEFSMPNTDVKFGFHRVAKHYYFPGWHQQASFGEFLINVERWRALSDADRKIIQLACTSNIVRSMSLGESAQSAVLDQFKKEGVLLHYWPKPMLERFEQASAEVMAEESRNDPFFAKTWESVQKFRGSYSEWAVLSRLPRKAFGQ